MTLEEALQKIDLEQQAQAIREEAEIYKDKLAEAPAAYVALPAFVLGLVGGAIGAKVLKGTVGVVVGGAAGLWAYDKLQTGPKTLAAGQNVPGKVTVAAPPKKQLEGCTL